jgi:hypothetical protein
MCIILINLSVIWEYLQNELIRRICRNVNILISIRNANNIRLILIHVVSKSPSCIYDDTKCIAHVPINGSIFLLSVVLLT